jgi:thiamine pyrophosphate-dependent acetolactate synthase large subunit-like protein
VLDFEALAAGFGFKSVRAGQADTLAETLKRAFDEDGPILVELAVDPDSGSIY